MVRTAPLLRPAASTLYLAAAVSWLGLLVHNVADLPGQTLASPETLYPTLVLAAVLVLLGAGVRRLAGGLLLAWAVLHLVGGAILSVLPLPVLPFAPEQSVRHYSFHVLYGLTQLPLLVLALREVSRSGPRGSTGSSTRS
ncbi:hypothetical protein ACQEVB_28105 [Pseudonocardia sp. CA-107938]|uniref:hypothetical protein n=1 Tax=Pseudonocardia sp. CA-107938 TaxID=3240021 RepID=UPI003D8F813A